MFPVCTLFEDALAARRAWCSSQYISGQRISHVRPNRRPVATPETGDFFLMAIRLYVCRPVRVNSGVRGR